MSAILDELKHVVTVLEDEGHALAGKARTVLTHYEEEAAAVVNGVKPLFDDFRTGIEADVKAVFAEAKTEGADIVARAEAAVAKLEDLLKQQPTPPAAS